MSHKLRSQDPHDKMYLIWSTPARYWDQLQQKWVLEEELSKGNPTWASVVKEVMDYSDKVVNILKRDAPNCHMSMQQVTQAFGDGKTPFECAKQIIHANTRT